MLAGKRVRKEIILAMVPAVLLLAVTVQNARATTPTCTAPYGSPSSDVGCYGVQFINYFSNAAPASGKVYARVTAPLEANADTGQPEEICAMFYVFDWGEAMQECCGCPITADGLLTLSIGEPSPPPPTQGTPAGGNLTGNPYSAPDEYYYASGAAGLQDGVIRLISAETNGTTTPSSPPGNESVYRDEAGTPERLANGVFCDRFSGLCCDPAGANSTIGTSAVTLYTTVRGWADHVQNDGVTNTAFEENPISRSDAGTLASVCATLLTAGTGNGYCNCGDEFYSEDSYNEGTGGE